MYTDPLQQTFRLTPGWKRFFLLMPSGIFGAIFLLLLVFALVITLASGRSISSLLTFPLLILLGSILAGCLLSYLLSWLLWRNTRHVATPDGIQFYMIWYSIYTPWSNIAVIAPRLMGAFTTPSLILKQPAVKGSIEEGRQQGVATIKMSRWTGDQNIISSSIPLMYTVPRRNWEASDLGMAIRNYAPQLFNSDPAGSPDQQRLRKAIWRKMLLAGAIQVLAGILLDVLVIVSMIVVGSPAEMFLIGLSACFWLLLLALLVYQITRMPKAQTKNIARRFSSYFMLIPFVVMLIVCLLKLAYIWSWSADPVSTFIGEHVQTLMLIHAVLVATSSFTFTVFANRLTAKDQKQLAKLEQAMK